MTGIGDPVHVVDLHGIEEMDRVDLMVARSHYCVLCGALKGGMYRCTVCIARESEGIEALDCMLYWMALPEAPSDAGAYFVEKLLAFLEGV